MKKIIKILLILILIIIAYVSYKYITFKPTLISANLDPTYKFYMAASENEILEHINKPNSTIKQADILSLIDREMNVALEVLLNKYAVNPDIGVKTQGFTPLSYAAEELKVKSLEILIKYGANVNYIDRHDKSILIMVSNSLENLTKYGIDPDGNKLALKATKLLVEAGAKINIVGDFGETAIGGAVIGGDLERVKYLVDHGGNVDYLDRDGANYMFYCDLIECIEYFISNGIDINGKATDGENILMSLVKSSLIKLDVITGIVELGIDICHKDNNGDTVLHHSENKDINSHLKKDNPKGYNEWVLENKASETYKYLEKEYNKRCLDKSSPGTDEVKAVDQ